MLIYLLIFTLQVTTNTPLPLSDQIEGNGAMADPNISKTLVSLSHNELCFFNLFFFNFAFVFYFSILFFNFDFKIEFCKINLKKKILISIF